MHFPGGAAATNKAGERWLVPSVSIDPEVILSSVGAGDAFAAGVLYGVYNKHNLKQCAQLGHAIAAASLRSNTTVGSVTSVAECLQLANISLDS